MRRLLGDELPYREYWDPNLNTFSAPENVVRSCNVRVIPAEDMAQALGRSLKPGDKVWRVVRGQFLDEQTAGGRVTITVAALDEQGKTAMGSVAMHGWPQESLPGMDKEAPVTVPISLTTGSAEFTMAGGNCFPEGPQDICSYWVGISPDKERLHFTDLAVGFGLPGNRHVCYEIVFQLMEYQPLVIPSPQPMVGKQYRVKLTWTTDPEAGEGVLTIEGEV